MPRIRSIHPDACKGERINRASAEAERCFWRLLTHCDDEGRAEDHPVLILSALFPLARETSPETMDGWLTELADVGLIARYEHGERAFLQVVDWDRFQHPQKALASKLPGPSTNGNREVKEDSRRALVPLPLGEGEGVGVGEGDIRGAARRVFDAWCSSTGRQRAVFDQKRARLIEARLKEFDEATLIAAVGGWAYSPFHCGENDRGRAYNDLGLLLRDAQHVEQFTELARAGPQVTGPRGAGAIARAVARRLS